MSNYRIVGGRIFQGREIENANKWLNELGALGWDFVSVLPIVEDGHAMYVFRNSGGNERIDEGLPAVPEPSYSE